MLGRKQDITKYPIYCLNYNLSRAKILVVGHAKSGKTSLITKLSAKWSSKVCEDDLDIDSNSIYLPHYGLESITPSNPDDKIKIHSYTYYNVLIFII